MTPDGTALIDRRTDQVSDEDLWALPLDGGEPRLLLQTPFEESGATISPDGRWMAYHSNEPGRAQRVLEE